MTRRTTPARTKPAPSPAAAKPASASLASRSGGKGPAKASKPTKVEPPAKAGKVLKKAAQPPRQVRDSFTMPESDFALIALLKTRALTSRRAAKKSELLRAGLHALAALDASALVASLDRLDPVKIGRPKKGD